MFTIFDSLRTFSEMFWALTLLSVMLAGLVFLLRYPKHQNERKLK